MLLEPINPSIIETAISGKRFKDINTGDIYSFYPPIPTQREIMLSIVKPNFDIIGLQRCNVITESGKNKMILDGKSYTIDNFTSSQIPPSLVSIELSNSSEHIHLVLEL